MAHKDRGHYAKKHSTDSKIDPRIADALKGCAFNREISCAEAFKIAGDLDVNPAEVGRAADLLEMTIVKCRLGLYGYGPKKRIIRPSEIVPQALEENIRAALVKGRLGCEAAWKIADRLHIGKMEVSSACEAMKIKIASCQLGSF